MLVPWFPSIEGRPIYPALARRQVSLKAPHLMCKTLHLAFWPFREHNRRASGEGDTIAFRKAVLSLAVLLLTTAPLALAQGTYTQIDVPGSLETLGYGIDNAGDIVGGYLDSNDSYHGFLLSGGIFTTLDSPGATST